MKRGTSRISIIIIGAAIVVSILAYIAYQGIYAHKKVFVSSVVDAIEEFKSDVNDVRETLLKKDILSTKFVATVKSNIDENFLDSKLRMLQKFINENTFEGKIDLEKKSLNSSIKFVARRNFSDSVKMHMVTENHRTHLTFYEDSNNEYMTCEKPAAIILGRTINAVDKKEIVTKKILKYVIDEVDNKEIILEKDRLILDDIHADTAIYSLELSKERATEIINQSFEKILKDKKLLIDLDNEISFDPSLNKSSEELIKRVQKDLLTAISKIYKIKLSIYLDVNTNKVLLTSFENISKDEKNNYKLDVFNLKTKDKDLTINLYKNKELVASIGGKKIDSSSYNLTVGYDGKVLNTLLRKVENGYMLEYSMKENIKEIEENKTDDKVVENKIKLSGRLVYTEEKGKDNVSYKITAFLNGTYYDKDVKVNTDINGTYEDAKQIEELDKNLIVKKYDNFPMEDVIAKIIKDL